MPALKSNQSCLILNRFKSLLDQCQAIKIETSESKLSATKENNEKVIYLIN